MGNQERERSSEKLLARKKPYFVRFLAAHQSKSGKDIDAPPFLVLARHSGQAIDKARRMAKGVKKHCRLPDVEEVSKEKFTEMARQRLEEGGRLPKDIIAYTGLQDLARKLRE